MSSKTITGAVSALLMLLFLYTAASKLSGLEAFTSFMMEVGFNKWWSSAFARVVPLTQIGVVILLFFQNTRLAGLYASSLIMLAFTAYIIYMMFFVTTPPCSCGGVVASLTWPQHLVFNIILLAISVVATILQRRAATMGNK